MTTAFLDVDTQLDFMFPAGALYVPGAELLLPAFERLTRHAAAAGIPLVSTVDAHTENDPEFRVWPPHCVIGTAGQQKAARTLLENRALVHAGPGPASFEGAPQIVVEKHRIDIFEDSNLRQVIERLPAERYVVYGLVTEYCVRCGALGLLRAGKKVELVRDAIRSLGEADERRTLDEFTAAGGRLTTVAAVCGG